MATSRPSRIRHAHLAVVSLEHVLGRLEAKQRQRSREQHHRSARSRRIRLGSARASRGRGTASRCGRGSRGSSGSRAARGRRARPSARPTGPTARRRRARSRSIAAGDTITARAGSRRRRRGARHERDDCRERRDDCDHEPDSAQFGDLAAAVVGRSVAPSAARARRACRPRARPRPAGISASASAPISELTMCEPCGPFGNAIVPPSRALEPDADRLLARRIAGDRLAEDRLVLERRARRAPCIAPSAGRANRENVTTAETGIAGQAEHERAGRASRTTSACRAAATTPQNFSCHAEARERRLDVVVGTDRDAAGDDHHVGALERRGQRRLGRRRGHRGSRSDGRGVGAAVPGQRGRASARWSCGSPRGRAARPGRCSSSPVQRIATRGRRATIARAAPAATAAPSSRRSERRAGARDGRPCAHVLARPRGCSSPAATAASVSICSPSRHGHVLLADHRARAVGNARRRSRSASPRRRSMRRRRGRTGARLADDAQAPPGRPGWTANPSIAEHANGGDVRGGAKSSRARGRALRRRSTASEPSGRRRAQAPALAPRRR